MATTAPDVYSKLNEHLALVNELLPEATPHGAYVLGAITGMALMSGKFPPRVVLELAARAPSMEKAVDLAKRLKYAMKGTQEWQGGR